MKLRRWFSDKIGRPVVVHLSDGNSVQGFLTESGEDYVVLVKAQVLGETSAEIGGECVLLREKITLVQVLRTSGE